MMALRALRSNASRAAPRSSTSSLAAASRGYATVAEEAAEINKSLYDQKVDMSQVEKGKGYYIQYKKLADNLEIVRKR